MRILVSGARGFIGSALVARLTAEEHVVHRLVRHDPRPGEGLVDLASHRVDASRLPGGSLEGIDVIFNLAGEPITPWRWSATKREAIRSSRVSVTDAIARSIAELDAPLPAFVAMSAIGYYGDRGEEMLDESSSSGTGTLADVCRAWEAATAPASDAGARVVNVRTGVVLGRGGGSLRLQVPVFKAGLGGRLGNGRQWTSWIALDDEVGVLLHAACSPGLSGACNATSPEPVRNSAMTAALGAALGRAARLAVPRIALEIFAGPETTREMLCASQRVLPTALEASGYTFSYPSLDAALAVAVGPGSTARSGSTHSSASEA